MFGRLINTIGSIITSIVIFIYVMYHSVIVGIEILIFLVILFIILKIYNPKLKQAHEEKKVGQDKLTSLINESVRGIREIKTLGIKNNLLENAKEYVKMIFKASEDKVIEKLDKNIQIPNDTKVIINLYIIYLSTNCPFSHVLPWSDASFWPINSILLFIVVNWLCIDKINW